jgi:hypothetical protein
MIGPDDAVHDWHGVFTIYDPENRFSGKGLIEIHDVRRLLEKAMFE